MLEQEPQEEKKFNIIGVISKDTGKVIKIKDYRFNSEYHEQAVEAQFSDVEETSFLLDEAKKDEVIEVEQEKTEDKKELETPKKTRKVKKS